MNEDNIRKTVIPLDENESACVYIWQNHSGTLYEIELHAVGGEVLHKVKRFDKLDELGEI